MSDLAEKSLAAIEALENAARAVKSRHGHCRWALAASATLDVGSGGLEDLIDIGDSDIAGHMLRNDPDSVLLRCAVDRVTVIRCQEALLTANPMLVHFAKQTLRERAESYGLEVGE